jgi:hypothetical protein
MRLFKDFAAVLPTLQALFGGGQQVPSLPGEVTVYQYHITTLSECTAQLVKTVTETKTVGGK